MQILLKMIGLSLCILLPTAKAAPTVNSVLKIGQTSVHFGIYESDSVTLGDILYFHGFGDRFENHEVLFKEWTSAGFRVVTFDMPSHGETTGSVIGGIDFHSFKSLAEIGHVLVNRVRGADDQRPFFLAGWSLGGLLATRIAQEEELRDEFPLISGLILYAPAVAPQKCVGNIACQVTNSTLSQNHFLQTREVKPLSPLLHLPFAARLALEAAKSWHPPLPSDLQTIVFTAADYDAYVLTPLVKKWVGTHRSNYVSRITAYQCRRAYHELDNEPNEYGGDFVRALSREFVSTIARGALWQQKPSIDVEYPCISF